MKRMRNTLMKYVIVQLPGWIIFALLLALLRLWLEVPLWIVAAAMVVWIVKDAIIFRYVRPAYEEGSSTADGSITGGEGVARERLDPSGYILLDGRLWRARVKKGYAPVEEGQKVSVEGRSGLTLIVVPRERAASGH